LITIECVDCRNILGHAYSMEDEGNRTLDHVDDPLSVGIKDFIRCNKCYRKWQYVRDDLPHTHLVNDTR